MINIFKFAFSQSFYMRKQPPGLVTFSGNQGKQFFKEALEDGTMECYFPLAEQFLTQHKPSTCGATTLVMVLNALKVDPQIKWKGIWRWYDEVNLLGLKTEHLENGINLINLSHIARHNRLAIHTFYHPAQLTYSVSKPERYDCQDECAAEDHPLNVVSLETFRLCIEASSRRTGFFIIVNNSRKALGQTGSGHFFPIGGYNRKQQMALLMDVARFKYPPHWCSIELLHDSMSQMDSSLQMTRGMCLVSKSLEYSSICRVAEDLPAKQKINDWFRELPSYKDPLPREILLSLVIFLHEFLERRSFLNIPEKLSYIQDFSTLQPEQVQQKIIDQPILKGLIEDFSFRNEDLQKYLGLLLYNYFFNRNIKEAVEPVNMDLYYLDAAIGLNLVM